MILCGTSSRPVQIFVHRHLTRLVPVRHQSEISNVRRTKPIPKSRTKIVPDGKDQLNFQNDSIEVIAIDSATRAKNAVLAVTLAGFCFGVAYYSMNAVGQSGADQSDPLSVLKHEAATAQAKHGHLEAEETKSADLIRQFQAGEFDPDRIEDDIDQNKGSNKARSWWKFW